MPPARVPASGLAVATRVSSPTRRSRRFPSCSRYGWFTSMPTDQDLFSEEQSMATMSFGEHIEELRVRLILALLGLFVGVIVGFHPAARHRLAGHEEDGRARQGGARGLLPAGVPEEDRPGRGGEIESARASGRRRGRHVRRRAEEDRSQARASRRRDAQGQDAQLADPVLRRPV